MLWSPESDDWEAGLRGLEARHASSREMRPEENRRGDQKRTEETRREQKRAAGTKERPEDKKRPGRRVFGVFMAIDIFHGDFVLDVALNFA